MLNLWKPIPGFAGYEASDSGQVRNAQSGRVLTVNKFGKSQLWIGGRNVSIRTGRLILLAFKGPSPNPEHSLARHLDDDLFNNRPDNLAWGSVADNTQDALRNGTDFGAWLRGRKQSLVTIRKRALANSKSRGPYRTYKGGPILANPKSERRRERERLHW
jgi:hypothetical protein